MEEIVYIKNGEVVHPLPRPPKPAPYIIESSVELKKVKDESSNAWKVWKVRTVWEVERRGKIIYLLNNKRLIKIYM